MLLFSTILDISDTVTPEAFVKLVLEWNDTSSHAENRVPGISWNGEYNVRYGNDNLWLEIIEYPEKNILAVRHEKITADGVTWDSDFVVNFNEKRIAIQLDRTYSEDALVMDAAFSTPHFITLLIEHGFLENDYDLPVLRTPICITDDNADIVQNVIEKTKPYKLPVVIVTKTDDDTDPLNTSWLASRLKGAAHVLVEDSRDNCIGIRKGIIKTDNPNGIVRIEYPSDALDKKVFSFRSSTGDADIRLEKVIRNVIQYGIAQRIDRLFTWQGVVGEVLNEQLKHQISIRKVAEHEKRKAEDEVDKVYEIFDEDLRMLQEKVEELTRANEALQYENQGLRAKYTANYATPIIYLGNEDEFYQGEIRDMVLGTLDEALSATEKATRKADVLEDILENNTYYHLSDERKQRLKALFKGYKNMTGAMRQELLCLGFEITEAGKHYKITYKGDQRYMVTVGKTPSDNRAGSNNAAMISKTML